MPWITGGADEFLVGDIEPAAKALEPVGVGIDEVPHLQSRGFRCGRCGERVLMSGNKRKLAERDVNLIAKLTFHLFQDRMKQPARRTLKITKLFDVNRRAAWSMCVRGFGARHACDDRLLLRG